ncbi:MAG: single-stranded-DNA-specific exonuclease RecJ [Candidatus Portnoybacteria bacterium RBG_13_41_18]|uniref:Single-stranded-DNA-specific exonuclease RecJ n=1 Tax=Candidatus Portnoybacteria bacterium RBG_13_41_18 TaxID=1801991 RepID=A0A1G2F9R0_9BACT|nr:MAG: single-stranded-DNA-specific exonuclease RecJ [Candidatus Portnoybacteria bacterium RBG_13_41_18]
MNWHLKPKVPEDFIKKFPEFNPLVLQLLYNRGLTSQKSIDEFFNPDYGEDLHDPFLMLGMKKAVKRIEEAIKKQESVAIFGDYDADGVCGAVILKTIFEALGANLSGGVYIPDRKVEGYGLNIPAIQKLSEKKVDLIVTVDCGSSDFKEIDLANSLGMEVIVVDHHQVSEKLPKAEVIINPWQKKEKYPFKDLAGAGVAFKLAQGLISKALSAKRQAIPDGWEKWLLDLVAIATVADCEPLLGENRTLVRYGLIVLAQTQRLGLQELMKIARLSPIFFEETLKTNLDTYSLGFILGPRLNAAGRMEHASLAYELLISEDREKARVLAETINQHNQNRQKLTEEIALQVEEKIKDKISDKSKPVIVVSDSRWSPAIIGLVAGKISDRYHRPVIIFSAEGGSASGGKEEGEISRGSARSIPAFDIVKALGVCRDLLKEFGGHPGAAGLSIENKNLLAFEEKINQIAREVLKEEDLAPSLEIDCQINAQEIDWKLFDELTKFEPCDEESNPRPRFLIKDLEIVNSRLVGNGNKHLKLELFSMPSPQMRGGVGRGADKDLNTTTLGPSSIEEGRRSHKASAKIFKAIGFRLGNGNSDLKPGDRVDLVVELILDEWNGNRELQMKIIDIKIANNTRI